MLKKTITYTDFNDEEVSEDFYFHLSKAELVELEMSHEGGLSESLQKIIAAEDGKQIIAEFKNIILGSYGKRSPDGRRFIKNQTLREEFESTEAYSTLFMELVTNTDSAIEFINGIIPAGMTEEAAKAAGIDPQKTPIIAIVTDNEETKPESKSEPQKVTRAQLELMPVADMWAMGARIQSGEVVLVDD